KILTGLLCAVLLLMAAAIACYSSSLSGALDARKTRYDSITATSSLEFGTNAVGQKRITGMSLDFSVRMNGEDSAIFERVAKVMRNGCLVTGSLHDGIEMKYRLEADCEE
ncbi:MAG: OsmC family protein, partial [Desulfovibrionaceae bacterium]|nr:OsmC family protein [Desulfovibrionaceae bacterium]